MSEKATEWVEHSLADVCKVITDGAHYSPLFCENGYPMASVKDMTRSGIDIDKCKMISRSDYEKLVKAGCNPKYGDVLIAKDGATCLDTVCVYHQTDEIVLLSSIALLRPGLSLNARFLKYYFETPSVKRMLKEGYVSGSAIPRVILQDFKRAPILLPPLNEQQAIAHILGTLDDKIELNRRMNETLEGIARALFRSWFIDFDPVRAKAEGRQPFGMDQETAALFPDQFEDSELGEIPKGWKVGNYIDVINILAGGTPKTSNPEYWDGEIPWFSVVDAPNDSDVFVMITERMITQAGIDNSAAAVLPVNTVIISARGTVGKIALTGVPMAMNQSCYGLQSKLGAPFYTYFLSKHLVTYLKQNTHGTVFDTITRDTFVTVPTIIPNTELIRSYEVLITPIMAKIQRNLIESNNIIIIRNLLLPKLISGSIRVDPSRFGYYPEGEQVEEV